MYELEMVRRERETERDRHTQIDRQTGRGGRVTDRQTNRGVGKERDTHTHRQTNKQRGKGGETGRQTDK